MKIIDTHCHPYLNSKKDISGILKNFFENSWEALIIIWTDLENSLEALEIAKTNEKIFVAIWIHPCDIKNLNLENAILKLKNIYKQNPEKIVAIWEIWLDYYWLEIDANKFFEEGKIIDRNAFKNEIKQKQKLFFKAQINLAKELNLPIVIHNRDAKNDIFEILKEENFKNFVFHCFSENLDFAKKVLEFSPNAMISFSGILTFKNAIEIKETAKDIPLENILAETDSPYLTPMPFRWKEENEPIFTKYVIEDIAKLKNQDLEYISEKIFENSKKFFWI